ncbi:AAA family ATPase [Arthrobacter sp. B10-11]|uniref:AAA family ATPase n=1 Tax=Arthrobacter sp. B10-11 TaxID=3081160 RepID=UPI002953D210|nr:AAA family ATPase [Arthrobacter sp. B10-11]MDV8148539.1 AAA family ATPase [Arthrobacter sp. B10-11]
MNEDYAQPPEDYWTGRAEEDATQAEVNDAAVRRVFPTLDWAKLWDDESEQEWIVEPILPARRMVALYSPPKTGKSLLMLEMAAAIAARKPVLGVTPTRKYRTLYVDFENDPKEDVVKRLKAMGYGPTELENLCYLSFPNMGSLDTEQGALDLMAAIDAYKCEVAVIDTISRAIEGEENENNTWLRFYRHTGYKIKQQGVSLIRLDHSGKDETKGQRGGSAKGGDVDAVWRLSQVTKDTTYRLDCEMNRMPVGEKTLVLHRVTSPYLHHRVDGAGRKAAYDAKIVRVMEILAEAGLDPSAGRAKAVEALKAVGESARTETLSEALRRRKTGFQEGLHLAS